MIYTSRHCHRYDTWKPEWKKESRVYYDPPLSPEGITQAISFRDQLHNVKRVYCSPFLRCIQTAYHATSDKGTPICIDYALMENMRSDWFSDWDDQGSGYLPTMDLKDLKDHYPTIDLSYKSSIAPRANLGESRRDCRNRVNLFVGGLLSAKEDNFYLVSHGIPTKDANVRLGLNGTRPYMGRFDKINYYWNEERKSK